MSTPKKPRRARVTLRCLAEDLRIALPGLDTDLGTLEHPALDETRRLAPTSPVGQKRIESIDHPLVYRLRVSRWRGATWVDEREDEEIVWLLAIAEREEGSSDDAFEVFRALHDDDALLPGDDDRLRDRAEAAIRFSEAVKEDAPTCIIEARRQAGQELTWALGDRVDVVVLVRRSDGLEEVWVAVPDKDRRGDALSFKQRDVVFAAFLIALGDADWEQRYDWPTRALARHEIARLYLREE